MSHQEYDDDTWRCVWKSGGERCGYPGAASHSTRGGGPWYCVRHLFSGDMATGREVVEQSRSFVRGGERQPRSVVVFEYPKAPAVKPRLPYVEDTPELVQEEPGAHG